VSAEVVLPCAELAPPLAFFTERLGFRLEAIFPADEPRTAVLAGHGLRLRLERGADGGPGRLRLVCRAPAGLGGGERELRAPNGTRIELVPAAATLSLPPARPVLELARKEEGAWKEGRAGMRYRDLLPTRQGGRFIASHIAIPAGGPVPDYVHWHRVRFQMIFCRAGWVRLVYEDQGPPFVMEAGDAVLQPPGIRHRVLESSPGLEVVELSSPAEHETYADHELLLPTASVRPERSFGGQRFVRHRAAAAPWRPAGRAGFEARELGFAAATDGLAEARVLRRAGASSDEAVVHDAELSFLYVLSGAAALRSEGRDALRLDADASAAIPAGLAHALEPLTADLELLEVTLPARVETRRA